MASESEATIRPASERDSTAIYSILLESPEASLWTETSIEGVFQQSGIAAFIAEISDRPTGFIIARWVAGEAEILNLAVRVQHRRRGLAANLFRRLLEELREHGTTRLFLEVRQSNATAIRFYQKLGFTQIGRRNGYYRNPPGNALVLEKRLESTG
jgi:[ribosomal protein S18]-alanine N-acetyltransferase